MSYKSKGYPYCKKKKVKIIRKNPLFYCFQSYTLYEFGIPILLHTLKKLIIIFINLVISFIPRTVDTATHHLKLTYSIQEASVECATRFLKIVDSTQSKSQSGHGGQSSQRNTEILKTAVADLSWVGALTANHFRSVEGYGAWTYQTPFFASLRVERAIRKGQHVGPTFQRSGDQSSLSGVGPSTPLAPPNGSARRRANGLMPGGCRFHMDPPLIHA